MKKNEVQIGKTYVAKVSGKVTVVRLERESPFGGWDGTNIRTGRRVHVKTAGRLWYEYVPHPLTPRPLTLRAQR